MVRGRTIGWLAATGLVAPLALAAGPAQAATAARPWDVDGDGKPDLVVGAPLLDRAAIPRAGGVVVVPPVGGRGATRIITQSTSGVAGGSEDSDYFGSAVASADFDADGYADLAVGIPGEDAGDDDGDEGAVTILYGTAKGLTGARSVQLFEPSGRHRYAGFGTALAAGDLDGDGYPDLAVGAVDDLTATSPVDDFPASGTVTVLRGSATGITTSGSRLLRGDRGSAWDHHFGSSLAVGDVDDDGRADLVVVSEGASADGTAHDGSLSYCAGATAGPTGCRRLLHNARLRTASSLVVGNVQGSSRPEVVVGVPVTDVDSDPGSVQVVRLFGSGPGTTGAATRYRQADLGLPGSGEESGDYFGASLAIGSLVGDGYADLVVGAPGEAVGDEEAGRVFVVRGGGAGLATSGNLAFDQDTAGVPGGSERGDRFGAALSLLDRDGDGRADLTVGSPGEDDDEGRVTTLLGTGNGFSTAGARAYGLREVDVNYDNRYGARFGQVLAR